MQGLTRILLKMQTLNAHFNLLTALHIKVNDTFTNDRLFELGDLIALRQIRVEVVFAVKNGLQVDLGLQTQTGLNSLTNTFFVDHWQHARHRRINQAHIIIRIAAKAGRSAREKLGFRGHLSVNLHADYDFPVASCALDEFLRIRSARIDKQRHAINILCSYKSSRKSGHAMHSHEDHLISQWCWVGHQPRNGK